MFITPDIRKCPGNIPADQHLHTPIIMISSRQRVFRRRCTEDTLPTSTQSLCRVIRQCIKPCQKYLIRKVSINYMGQQKWRNQNNVELRREGSSTIMVKFNSKQLQLKFTNHYKTYSTVQDKRGYQTKSQNRNFDIQTRNPSKSGNKVFSPSSSQLACLNGSDVWIAKNARAILIMHPRRCDFLASRSWRSVAPQKCACAGLAFPSLCSPCSLSDTVLLNI